MKKTKKDRPEWFALAEKAMNMAVKGVIEERRRTGMPLLVWKNGRVTKVAVK
jgi:hypothetical protein